MKTEIRNILSVFDQATPEERRFGSDWYFIAHKEAVTLAKEFKVSVPTAAGVIAVLSPNQRWETNLSAARKLLQAVSDGKTSTEVRIPTYGKNKEKAFQLALGGDRRKYLVGPKVNCFYKNIVSPWSSTSITVDTHALSIWRAERRTVRTATKGKGNKLTPKRYAAVVTDYKEAARELQLRPWQLQAIAWITWRRLNKIGASVAA